VGRKELEEVLRVSSDLAYGWCTVELVRGIAGSARKDCSQCYCRRQSPSSDCWAAGLDYLLLACRAPCTPDHFEHKCEWTQAGANTTSNTKDNKNTTQKQTPNTTHLSPDLRITPLQLSHTDQLPRFQVVRINLQCPIQELNRKVEIGLRE
jgi:hypothetical protein